ncbi:hypothetical protein PJE062_1941 [Pseudovibrio sp. JE062]|nr:hypothetical protein PJE062_1941 [Pseudovibrio sp. JE062]
MKSSSSPERPRNAGARDIVCLLLNPNLKLNRGAPMTCIFYWRRTKLYAH